MQWCGGSWNSSNSGPKCLPIFVGTPWPRRLNGFLSRLPPYWWVSSREPYYWFPFSYHYLHFSFLLFSPCFSSLLSSLVLIITLLLISGVEPNPGPTYTCGCGKTVGHRQHSIECSKCHIWYHKRCSKISFTAFSALSSTSRHTWQCPSCNTASNSISLPTSPNSVTAPRATMSNHRHSQRTTSSNQSCTSSTQAAFTPQVVDQPTNSAVNLTANAPSLIPTVSDVSTLSQITTQPTRSTTLLKYPCFSCGNEVGKRGYSTQCSVCQS